MDHSVTNMQHCYVIMIIRFSQMVIVNVNNFGKSLLEKKKKKKHGKLLILPEFLMLQTNPHYEMGQYNDTRYVYENKSIFLEETVMRLTLQSEDSRRTDMCTSHDPRQNHGCHNYCILTSVLPAHLISSVSIVVGKRIPYIMIGNPLDRWVPII